MALQSGIDTVAFVSNGVYSETYGSTGQANINNLFAFYGLLEDAPTAVVTNVADFHWHHAMFRW